MAKSSKRNSIITSIAMVSIFLIGLAILLYPAISNFVNQRAQSTAIVNYSTNLDESGEDKKQELWQQAEDYNNRLYKTSGAFFKPSLVSGYWDTLKLGDSDVIGFVTIPRIDVQLPIYHGTDDSVLVSGAGHLEGTSLPIGGVNTHSVIMAHRGLPSSKLFTDLDKMEYGDVFTLTVLGEELTYVVDSVVVIEPTQTDSLQIETGKDYCTLLTCTPYGINTHRLLVRGIRVMSEEEAEVVMSAVRSNAVQVDPLLVAPFIAVPLLVIAFALVFFIDSKKSKKRKTNVKK